MNGESPLTILLDRWRQGDENAASELLREVHRDLRRVAAGYLRGERADHTLQPTALLNEAWIRLAQSKTPPVADRQQFFRAMAAYMRRHLVDHARRRNADKRGAGGARADFDEAELRAASPEPEDSEAELQQLERALENLRLAHPRAAKVVELRFFAGKSVEDVASELSLGTGTIKRDFAFAKTFIQDEFRNPH
jgi:RNA polymerase sigma factor (TIGR02999 family)